MPRETKDQNTAFTIWQQANEARKTIDRIDEKLRGAGESSLDRRMRFLQEYASALDVLASHHRAEDIRDAMAHLSICYCDLEGLIMNEPSPDDNVTLERVFRLVSSSLSAVAHAAGLDLEYVTGSTAIDNRISEQFILKETDRASANVASLNEADFDIAADAELIGLCRDFDDLQHKKLNLHVSGTTPILDDRERALAAEPIEAQQEVLLGKILNLRAVTLDGVRARVRMASLWCELREVPADNKDWNDQMFSSIMRDFLEISG